MRYINEEVSMYNTYVESIFTMQEELADLRDKYPQIGNGVGGGGVSQHGPEEAIVIRISDLERRMKAKQWRVTKIDRARGLFKGNIEVESIIREKYMGGYRPTNEEIINSTGIERHKFYDLLNEIQYKFGVIFGVME
jgi:hypothetical protein